MAIAYWSVAAIIFSIVLASFVKDTNAPKFSADAWLFIAIATLLWPVTLPSILSSKLRSRQRTKPSKYTAEKSSPVECSAAAYFPETLPTQSQPPAVLPNVYTTSTCDL